ncbi:hypothetical protein HELRODRAFT_86461, partial [Helobdella robusta]|uniref:PHD-type domain-containing protein n=1 Tax=Helobdella robusta TaxID=6412 RepID=T1G6C5_HELRO
GEIVWICPTCGFPDNGTPMIGCDRCDDWYHWVCVNITKEPPTEMNWYCVRCLAQDPTLHSQTKNLSVAVLEVPPPAPSSAGRRGRPSGKGKSKKH